MNCEKCGKRLTRKTARKIDGVVQCSACMYWQTAQADTRRMAETVPVSPPDGASIPNAGHRRFTVSTTTYLRNLSPEGSRGECIAVHYQQPPRKTESGTSFGLRFPLLIVAGYVENGRAVAERVAAILEQHCDEPEGRS